MKPRQSPYMIIQKKLKVRSKLKDSCKRGAAIADCGKINTTGGVQ